jgi:hypothetical protein
MGSIPTELPQETAMIAECGDQGPMSQQDAVGSHGHEMLAALGCGDRLPQATSPPAENPKR